MIERGGARTPNPTIEFRTADGSVVTHRMWYHVPGVGDSVSLNEGGGIVTSVHWTDEKIVVTLKGES